MPSLRAAGRGLAIVLGAGVVALAGTLAVVALRHSTGGPANARHAPPAIASGAVMAFDPASKGLILFGGVDASGKAQNATWLWDGSGWAKLEPAQSPPARRDAALGWDPAGNQLILTGGYADTSSPGSPAACPMISAQPVPNGVAAGPEAGVVTSSGGAVGGGSGVVISGHATASGVISPDCMQSITTTDFTDTWAFDGTTWKQLHPAHRAFQNAAAARVHLATDSATDSLMLVAPLDSGVAGATAIACPQRRPPAGAPYICNFGTPENAVFSWKNGDWVAAKSFPGNVQAVTTDPSTGDIAVVFGPASPTCACCNVMPPAAANGGLAGSGQLQVQPNIAYPCPEAVANRTSGTTAFAFRSEVREWHQGSWVNITTAGSPEGLYLYAATDSTRNQLIVLTSEGQVWGLSKGSWTKLSDHNPLQQTASKPGATPPGGGTAPKPGATPLGIATTTRSGSTALSGSAAAGSATVVAGTAGGTVVTRFVPYSGVLADDPQTGYVILLAYVTDQNGHQSVETWQWNGTTWVQAGTSASPSSSPSSASTPTATPSPTECVTPTLTPGAPETSTPEPSVVPLEGATPAPGVDVCPVPPPSTPTAHAVPGGNGPPAAIN